MVAGPAPQASIGLLRHSPLQPLNDRGCYCRLRRPALRVDSQYLAKRRPRPRDVQRLDVNLLSAPSPSPAPIYESISRRLCPTCLTTAILMVSILAPSVAAVMPSTSTPPPLARARASPHSGCECCLSSAMDPTSTQSWPPFPAWSARLLHTVFLAPTATPGIFCKPPPVGLERRKRRPALGPSALAVRPVQEPELGVVPVVRANPRAPVDFVVANPRRTPDPQGAQHGQLHSLKLERLQICPSQPEQRPR